MRRAWSFETGNFINGAPAVVGNLVVFGGCDARLHLVSGIDGSETAVIDTGSYIPGSPAVTAGHVFVGNYGNRLLSVSLGTGAQEWTYSSDRCGHPRNAGGRPGFQ